MRKTTNQNKTKMKRFSAVFLAIMLTVSIVNTQSYAEAPPAGPGPQGPGNQIVAGTPYASDGTYDVNTSHVVINQVYGGDTDGYASHSFIELYNPSDTEVDLSSWSIQYKSSVAGGSSDTWSKLDLTGTIEATGYYLIRCAAMTDTSNVKYDVPEGQQSWNQVLYNKGLSVVLMDNQTLLANDDVYSIDSNSEVKVADGYVDMAAVGGNDIDAVTGNPEETEAPLDYETDYNSNQSKKKAIRRTDFSDTDHNATDFEIIDYSKTVTDEQVPHGYSKTSIIDVVMNIGSTEKEANVTWYASESGKLQIAKASDVTNGEFPSATGKVITYTATTKDTNYNSYISNSVNLKNLVPGTSYVYRVSSGTDEATSTWSENYDFTCQADGSDNEFGFLVVGDPQIGTGNTDTDTEGWIQTMQTALTNFSTSSFIVSVGDQIDSYTAGNTLEKQYQGFLNNATALTSIPLVTAVGNHDEGRGDASSYTNHYSLPNVSSYGSTDANVSGEEDYYFTHNNALFMVLNTNSSSISEHTEFIENTLAKNADAKWKIVVFHQSIYSVASHVSDGNIGTLRTGLSPVLAKNDIDVVLMGHDHVYARSYIMGGDTGMEADLQKDSAGNALSSVTDPNGVQYITLNSASGSKYYNITQEAFEYTAVQNQEKTQNYSYVNLDDDSFQITTYRSQDNSVVDEFTIQKTKKVQETKDISKLNAKLSKTSYTYNGKAQQPSVSISGLTNNKDFTVSYKNNKSVGTATVIITGKGAYTGTIQKTFKINPKGTVLTALKAAKKKITVKWKKNSSVTGYQIRYSTSSKYKNVKIIPVKSAKTLKKTISSLKKSKKYYISIRTYKTVNGKKYYSTWSKSKSKKTK